MELSTMKNLGPVMTQKLNAVGIMSAEELVRIGSKEAFLRMKTAYPNVCHIHLYVLQGAIDNVLFNLLAADVKAELKAFSDGLAASIV